MGSVVGFHAAASRLAAKSARISAVKPASRARGRASKADHHSAGIESLCHHFETEFAGSPISDASASRVDQISMMLRNDPCDIRRYLGQTVLNCKPDLSLDALKHKGHTVLMVPKIPRKEARRGFIQRTREARVRTGMTQEEIAKLLGIKQDRYKHYETNRPLPHELVLPFCAATEITPLELYGPMIPLRARNPNQRAS